MKKVIILFVLIAFVNTGTPSEVYSYKLNGYNITYIHDSPVDKPEETYFIFRIHGIINGYSSSLACPVAYIFDPEVKVPTPAIGINSRNINEFSQIFQWTMFCQHAQKSSSTSRLEINNYSTSNFYAISTLIHDPKYADHNCTLSNLQFSTWIPGAINCCCDIIQLEEEDEGLTDGELAAAIVIPLLVIIALIVLIVVLMKYRQKKQTTAQEPKDDQQELKPLEQSNNEGGEPQLSKQDANSRHQTSFQNLQKPKNDIQNLQQQQPDQFPQASKKQLPKLLQPIKQEVTNSQNPQKVESLQAQNPQKVESLEAQNLHNYQQPNNVESLQAQNPQKVESLEAQNLHDSQNPKNLESLYAQNSQKEESLEAQNLHDSQNSQSLKQQSQQQFEFLDP